ncbi:MAG: DHH family phosphoesterase [Thermoclostridium sp.]|nr:DHH family phosphoesterase [Thermoclostridium sp.]
MRLIELLQYEEIVIQCHDNPDADTLASAFGVYQYLKSFGKNPRIIFSGARSISKSNLLQMIRELDIPVEHVDELNNPELLLTVDCQYGEGNVTRFNAGHIAMIDHHDDCGVNATLKEICSFYSSCATLVYVMLMDEGFDVNADIRLSTALYYGLYMDSNCFAELKHPFDRDLAEDLTVDAGLIEQLKYNNFSLSELEVAGVALLRCIYDESKRYSIVKASSCDPNVMGLINDLIIQVDRIDCSIVYCELNGSIKLSIRSCLNIASANDIAIYLTENIGNGGGHKKKAGGSINGKRFCQHHGNLGIDNYLINRISSYFSSYDVVDTKKDSLDTASMKKYVKLPMPYGYVKTTDLAASGTEMIIRTLEGDVTIRSSNNIYILTGINGEVYPITKDKLFASYITTEEPYCVQLDYSPQVKNHKSGKPILLMPLTKRCIPTGHSEIYAKQIDKTTKVMSKWSYDQYMLGRKNDYIACRVDDPQDIYIIKESIFSKTYKPTL